MNVLMISIGPSIILNEGGGAAFRHKIYANNIGKLFIVVSSFKEQNLKETSLSDNLTVYPTHSKNKVLFLFDAIKIARTIIKTSSIDLIVTQDPFATGLIALILKKVYKIPMMIGNHSSFLGNEFWMMEKPIQNFIFTIIAKIVLKKADGMRVVNSGQINEYSKIGIPKSRIFYLPTPVPLDAFIEKHPKELINDLKNNLGIFGKKIALWVGDPNQKAKDIDTLFNSIIFCLRKTNNIAFCLIGNFEKFSPLSEEILRLINEKRLILLGHIDHNMLGLYYHMCDVYFHTSKYEGLPKVMIEASCAGKPIVSTNFSGSNAIVKDKYNGLTAKIGDHKTIAKHIIHLMNDDALRKKMGELSKKFVMENFNYHKQSKTVTNNWKKVYKNFHE